jgi:hypothetical protein
MTKRRAQRLLLLVLVAAGLGWGGLSWRARSRLAISQHLSGNVPLPFAPLGPPALHPDGRAFLVAAGGNLLSVALDGQVLWSRRLPGPALPWQGRPAPVLAQSLLLVQGAGQMHGYSLGGELRFSLSGSWTGPPCTDGRGGFSLIDEAGALAGFDREGRALLQAQLGLRRGRCVLLGDGRLLIAGAGADGSGEAVLCDMRDRQGQIEARLRLPAPPAGMALSSWAGEVALLGIGAEVLGLGPGPGGPLSITRRLSLPGPVAADPVSGTGEEVAVLVEKGGGLWLVRAGARQSETSLGAVAPALVRGGNGRLYAPFLAPSALLLDHAGVISLGDDLWRQPLPGPASSLTRSPAGSGAVLATVAGEPYLWIFEIP